MTTDHRDLALAQATIRRWQKSPDRPVAVARAQFLLSSAE